MKIGNREFETRRHTYVMGILNVTPDSFSDGGRWKTPDAALFRAQEMVNQGADVIDVGGESTRPGYTKIPDEEEIWRIAPVIEAIKSKIDIPLSVDTYKSAVAKAALDAGADMINDIWGLKGDAKIAEVICKYRAVCCLMHNRKEIIYHDFIEDVTEDLRKSLKIAQDVGISREKIILDPGIGFAKNTEQNLAIINHLEEITALGYPVLLGASRKSVIGNVLGTDICGRGEGTLVTTVIAVQKGCMFVRVHDVQANVRAIRMTHAVLGDLPLAVN